MKFKIAIAVFIVAALNIVAYTVFDPNSHEILWAGQIFNFLVLVSAIVWGLPKMMGKSYGQIFSDEREAVRARLAEAETKQRAAEEKLREVEARLRAMDEEAKRIAAQAQKDARADGERIRVQAEEDAKNAVEKVQREIGLRTEAAKRELRAFAAERIAEIAAKEAERRVDDPARERLFDRAIASLEGKVQ